MQCADCGRGAEVYDHRDYYAPLVVEPVCRPCNYKRGQAIPFVPNGIAHFEVSP